jgi:hypothetical protein
MKKQRRDKMQDKKLSVENLTEEEKQKQSDLEKLLAERSRENTKQAADKIVKFLGIVLATILFLISFSMLAPFTIFARMFGTTASAEWAKHPSIFSSGSIYYAFIGPSPTVAVLIMTVVQLALATLLAFLISLYVRDIIIVIKGVLKIGKSISSEVGKGVEEGLEEAGVKNLNLKKGKKPLFEEDEKKSASDYDLLQEKEKDGKPKISKKEEKLLKEIEKLSEPDTDVVEEAKPEPKVEEPTKMSDKEINEKIDSILNDQSLTTEEAQRQVAELEAKLIGKTDKKKLF